MSLRNQNETSVFWKVKPTEHFLIYYEKDSPAEKDIASLAELLEEYFRETAEIFGVKIAEKIPYYFHSGKIYHGNTSVWGYASRGDIHVVYSNIQKDSSPHELRHFINQRVNPQAPYFFNEGSCGLGIRIGQEGFHEKARVVCPDLVNYPLLELAKDFQKYGRLGDYLAYSFNSFLIEQYGGKKFAGFYKRANKDNWQRVIQEVYAFSPSEAQEKWRSFLCGDIRQNGYSKILCIGRLCLRVQVADSQEEKHRGLMFRQSLAKDEGMFFIYDKEGAYGFWMQNMRFPLDIIWIGKDKIIVDIRENAQPCNASCENIAPKAKAQYVLEVNSGFVQQNNLAVGDKVSFSY